MFVDRRKVELTRNPGFHCLDLPARANQNHRNFRAGTRERGCELRHTSLVKKNAPAQGPRPEIGSQVFRSGSHLPVIFGCRCAKKPRHLPPPLWSARHDATRLSTYGPRPVGTYRLGGLKFLKSKSTLSSEAGSALNELDKGHARLIADRVKGAGK